MSVESDSPSYQEYQHELDESYGRLGSHDYFQLVKVNALRRVLEVTASGDQRLSILDVGSGIGTILAALPDRHLRVGVEPDTEMIQQVFRQTHATILVNASGTELPFADDSFDVVYMASVLHHVPPDRTQTMLMECRRIIQPGGILVIFEHNAYNLPVVLFLKAFVKIDHDAHFFTPLALGKLLRSAQLSPSKPRFLCFFPGFLRFLLFLETYLAWLPLGGQFYIISSKSAANTSAGRRFSTQAK